MKIVGETKRQNGGYGYKPEQNTFHSVIFIKDYNVLKIFILHEKDKKKEKNVPKAIFILRRNCYFCIEIQENKIVFTIYPFLVKRPI